MLARSLIALGMLVAAWTPAPAEPPTSSYTIEQLKLVARSVHPTLESADAGVAVAQGAWRQSRAYPNPVFAATGGRGRPRDGGDSRSEYSFAIVQPIEFSGIRHWRSRVAELGLEGAEIDRTVAEAFVDSTVSLLAYTVLRERRRAEIAAESARVAGRLHEILARRAELGESSPLEAVKARTEWFGRRRNVLDAQGALEAARSALNLFCAGRLGTRYELIDRLDATGAIALPRDLVERMGKGNPILLRATVGVEQAEARFEVERKQTLPRIDVLAGYETELDRTGGSVGAGLRIPLWNRNRGAVEAASADRRRAGADVLSLETELRTELVRAIAEYERALAVVRLHREGWTEAAGQSLEIATFSFENGEASLLEVLDAQRAYIEVGLTEADSWAALNLARAEIERLIGGTLKTEADDETP